MGSRRPLGGREMDGSDELMNVPGRAEDKVWQAALIYPKNR